MTSTPTRSKTQGNAMINWTILFVAVAMIESSGNPDAVNQNENAVGIFQIRQCAIDDLNRHYGTDYKLHQFKGNTHLSKWAFIHYGRMYGAESEEEFCRIWNGGPNGMKKKATERYWNKIKPLLEQKNDTGKNN